MLSTYWWDTLYVQPSSIIVILWTNVGLNRKKDHPTQKLNSRDWTFSTRLCILVLVNINQNTLVEFIMKKPKKPFHFFTSRSYCLIYRLHTPGIEKKNKISFLNCIKPHQNFQNCSLHVIFDSHVKACNMWKRKQIVKQKYV